jgi:hypothetical protein
MNFDKTLDLNKEFNQKKKIYEKELIDQKIKNFNTSVEYKTKLLNIDSKFRNKIPKNIYATTNLKLQQDPIYTTKNSNIIKINLPNHNLSINNRVILQNVVGSFKTQNNCIFFLNNYNYAFINFKNHNIKSDYLFYVNNYQVDIEIINDINNLTLYNNIPINAIIGIQNVFLPSLVDKENLIPLEILSILNVSSIENLDNDFLLIKLPYNSIVNGTTYYVIPDVLRIKILSIGGIPLYYINSDFPINYERSQGYLNIINIDTNNIYLETSKIAAQNDQSGGNNIQLMSVINTLDGYPDANTYSISLKKNFNNVIRIELISTEFPYIDFLVKKTINKNNKLYWKHYDDGNHIYDVEINEGNYDSTSLISNISQNINNIERIQSTKEKPVYNIFNISLDTFTQEIKFEAFKNNKLPNCITVNLNEINNIQYVLLIFYHPGNLVEVNDTITVFGSTKIGTIIDASYINTTHKIYEINTTAQTYTVLLSPLNELTNLTTIDFTGNGGPSIIVKTHAKVSFLFNYSDTIGTVLGFKNVGEKNAITPYKTLISNFDEYIQYTDLNQVGNVDNSIRLLNLTGNNYYILMYLNNFETILNNSNNPAAFAKILLSGNPGDILFNTFINYPLEFDFPIPYLNELDIYFTYPDGTLVDFRNIDHSFTLRIIEKIISPTNTGLNSKDTSVIDTLKYEANRNV